jgi:hypothetical protein
MRLVNFERDLHAWLPLAPAQAHQACRESAGAANKDQDEGGVFRRVVTSGLGVQRKSEGKHQKKAEGEKRLFRIPDA